MTEEKHIWAPWLHYNILTDGCLVSEEEYFDAGGMKCMTCHTVVMFWTEKYREDVGKIEKRDTGKGLKDLPKCGCPGPLVIAETA